MEAPGEEMNIDLAPNFTWSYKLPVLRICLSEREREREREREVLVVKDNDCLKMILINLLIIYTV